MTVRASTLQPRPDRTRAFPGAVLIASLCLAVTSVGCDGAGTQLSDSSGESGEAEVTDDATGQSTEAGSSGAGSESTVTSLGDAGSVDGGGSVSTSEMTTSTSGDGSSVETDESSGDETGEDPDGTVCGREPAPGRRLVDGAETGTWICEGISLAAFIERAHAAFPELQDIDVIFDPDDDSKFDGSYIHAYEDEDTGGFALAFAHGWGDCEAGCIHTEWTYVRAGEDCEADAAGYYYPQWQQDPKCINVEGTARWGTPNPPDPINVCGEDSSPQNISGEYPAHIRGTWQPCTELGPDEPEQELDHDITVVIKQESGDLAKGTITLMGLEAESMDGRPFEAVFARQRGHVEFDEADATQTLEVQLRVDLEGCEAPWIQTFETIDFDDGSSCKGAINASIAFVP